MEEKGKAGGLWRLLETGQEILTVRNETGRVMSGFHSTVYRRGGYLFVIVERSDKVHNPECNRWRSSH